MIYFKEQDKNDITNSLQLLKFPQLSCKNLPYSRIDLPNETRTSQALCLTGSD